MTTLRNVRLSDPASPLNGVLVDMSFGNTITAIERAGAAEPSAQDADGSGRFVLPGLIDTHVHLGGRDALTAAARSGISTVIDLGTHPDALIHEQRALSGAPAILSAGSAASAPGSLQIAQMGFPAESGVTGPENAERYVDWRAQNGSDLIKIIVEDPDATDVPALEVATITALVESAHDHGFLTVAHVVTAAAFDRGLDAGVDILTHAPVDRVLSERTLQRMLEQRTVVSPTLVMMKTMARVRFNDRADEVFATCLDNVRAMHEAGVPIIAGTDANETPFAPVPHGPSIHDEIGYLREAGLTTAEALGAATGLAADAFGLRDRGRIVEGARADLVLVDGDPMAEPERLREPQAVWIDGIPVGASHPDT